MKGVVGWDYVEVLNEVHDQTSGAGSFDKQRASVRADFIGQFSQSIITLCDRCRHKS
jgi:hypothetical protein